METIHDKLRSISQNLWWTWRPEVRSIFRDLDLDCYHRVHRNPIAVLKQIDPARLDQRASEVDLPSRIDRARRQLTEYLNPVITWGLTNAGALQARPVAYFSAEFGMHECIPIYSGGLGILAADHLKGASDLGVPIVGVGLLYREGYVHQMLDRDHWQQDVIEPFDVADLPLEAARDGKGDPLLVGVELPGRTVYLRILVAQAGRARLLLLDSSDPVNDKTDQHLAARLYGGDQRIRIQQELLLGVGGIRALRALGIHPGALHLNEGHTAFAILEWARERVERTGLDPHTALHDVSASTVFTTHTPVEAGHDHFPSDLAAEFLLPLAEGLGLSLEEVLNLGRIHPHEPQGPFVPAVLALRHSRRANAVSARHGTVARRMWRVLWPERSPEEVPIGHITNGVHISTWLSLEMGEVYKAHLGPDWMQGLSHANTWTAVDAIDPGEIWEAKQILKARCLRFAREQSARMRARLGLPEQPPPLHPEGLTLGFARRFVPYKRPDLLFSDLDRLAALLNDPARPVNLLFAGRAHPADTEGKRLIQKVMRLTEDPRFAGRIVFLENHNIHVGRQLYQGVDGWLNTPYLPLEACGTSGMKAVVNGGLHISILDGWWAEAYDGENGFAIGDGDTHADPKVQDARDAESLYRVLEEEVVPLYFDREEGGLPRRWLQRVKRSVRTLAWRFSADRMVMDYARELYLPAARASSCFMPHV
ncbi:MAG TPA: alpha-glucan family phosphorylase [Holophagaceae bacterium]|nr:alpha-glucan family phosphorylase [Holophagaceae bacterium]